jgi:DNA-binding NtrC family response regulator
LVDGDVIGPEDLPEYIRREAARDASVPAVPESDPPRPLKQVVDEVEKSHILRTLKYTKGNKRRAIELLGLSADTFYRRMAEFGLRKKDEDP